MLSFLSQEVGGCKSQDALLSKLRYQTVLLDAPHRHPNPSSRRRPQRLTSKQKRQLHSIPPEQQRYEDFLPLHQLWLGYMEELLQLKSGSASALK